jgi:glycosyltransferase involved in cell wall biosynthesis
VIYSVAQIGRRRNYVVPRLLNEVGHLHTSYTDACGSTGWPRLLRYVPARLQPPVLGKLASRLAQGIPATAITTFTTFGLYHSLRYRFAKGQAALAAHHLWAGRTFRNKVIRHCQDSASALYAFNGQALELLRFCRNEGIFTALEQMSAPLGIEKAILEEEYARYPGWETPLPDSAWDRELAEREALEWRTADLVLAASKFTRDGLVASGADPQKCRIVSYGIEPERSAVERRVAGARPLRVLMVGNVRLQKGVQYTYEAARQLEGMARFRCVGRPFLQPKAHRELKK